MLFVDVLVIEDVPLCIVHGHENGRIIDFSLDEDITFFGTERKIVREIYDILGYLGTLGKEFSEVELGIELRG